MRRHKQRAPLTEAEKAFYAGFTPMTAAKPKIEIGSSVEIVGDHPHAGRKGKIVGVISLLGKPAIEVRFDDGDGCFVVDREKHRLKLI